MDSGPQHLRHVHVAALSLFLLAAGPVPAGADGGGGGGTGSGGYNAPGAPSFSGETTKYRPCRFVITLSAVDTDGDLDHFKKVSGALPTGFGLSGSKIDGPATCEEKSWTSEWKAVDVYDLESHASTLTLQCKRGTNSAPTAPTYSGTLVQTAPCSFAVTPVSGDAEGDPVAISIADATCLPPGHTFSGGSITGGPTSAVASWTCTFTADDGKCEGGASSSVTLQCEAPAPAIVACDEFNYLDCCETNPSDSYCLSRSAKGRSKRR